MDFKIRLSRPGDDISLKRLWKIAFEDEDSYIDAFFNNCYSPGRAVVADTGGKIASAVYVLDAGVLGGKHPSAYSYALATLPEHRGLGLGGEVTKAGIASSFNSGYECNVICPAGESLFPYYEKMGYGRCFSLRSFFFSGAPPSVSRITGNIMSTSPAEYLKIREILLPPMSVFFTLPFLEHVAALCELSGGGLFRLDFEEAVGCAAVEYDGKGGLLVKELLIPDSLFTPAANLIYTHFGAKSLSIRTPESLGKGLGGTVSPFALAIFKEKAPYAGSGGYFAFTFD